MMAMTASAWMVFFMVFQFELDASVIAYMDRNEPATEM
jgi:hypothetical protein